MNDLQRIKIIVNDLFKIDVDSNIKTREGCYPLARQLVMRCAHLYLGMTLQQAGNIFGKDHATVKHACKTIDGYIDSDKSFATQYADILYYVPAAVSFKKNEINLYPNSSIVVCKYCSGEGGKHSVDPFDDRHTFETCQYCGGARCLELVTWHRRLSS